MEYKSEIESTKDTPYLTLKGELWGVFCEDMGENWACYNSTALYLDITKQSPDDSFCIKIHSPLDCELLCLHGILLTKIEHNQYSDIIMSAMTSQITSVSIVYSTVCSGTDQRKLHQWLVDSPHKGPVTWKLFPFDDIIISSRRCDAYMHQ